MLQDPEFIDGLQSQVGGLVLFGAVEKRLVLLAEVKMLADFAVITVLDDGSLVSYWARPSEVEFLKAGPADRRGAFHPPKDAWEAAGV